jgi:hypothetical protein
LNEPFSGLFKIPSAAVEQTIEALRQLFKFGDFATELLAADLEGQQRAN